MNKRINTKKEEDKFVRTNFNINKGQNIQPEISQLVEEGEEDESD